MTINILTFDNLPILDQLVLEEGLLRTSHENYVLINIGSPKAIVMGISSKPEEVVNMPLAMRDNVQLIQRFSGGGTVIIDENTLFVTFIFQKNLHSFELYPKKILEWAYFFFKSSLDLPGFSIQGNDFALQTKKIGGNAQYIKKDRFLHHTSFLWDFTPSNMDYLLHPPVEPAYRQGRSHLDFITPLSPYISKNEFKTNLITSLATSYKTLLNNDLPIFPDHRLATKIFN